MKTTCLPLAAVLAAAIALSGCGKAVPAAPTAPQAKLAARSMPEADAQVRWAIDQVLSTKTKFIVKGQAQQTAPFKFESPLQAEISLVPQGVTVDGLPANPEAVKRLLTSAQLGPKVDPLALKRALAAVANQAGQGEWTLTSTSVKQTRPLSQDHATTLKGHTASGEPVEVEVRVEYLRVTRVYVKVNGKSAPAKTVVAQLVGAKLDAKFPVTMVNGAIATLTDPQSHIFQ